MQTTEMNVRQNSVRHFVRNHCKALVTLAAVAGLLSCVGEPSTGGEGSETSVAEQRVSLGLLQQRSNAIKAVHAADPAIHNPVIFAGIAYAESEMAHCYSEYYNQVSTYVCAGPASSDCGGAVTAGYWDDVCGAQQGGLGMWQFDEGTHTQTINKWATSGYWNNQKRDILDVEGSIAAAIDFINFKAWYSSATPYFANYQAMYDWINQIRPVDGNADYELWLGFLANSYNGQAWGSADWSAYKERYRTATAYVYTTMGGAAYWYGTTPVPTCGGGLYCAVRSIPGSSACLKNNVKIYCCPKGQTIVNGVCTPPPVPPCGTGLYCSAGAIPGASACMSGSTKVYCCPAGKKIVNGACQL